MNFRFSVKNKKYFHKFTIKNNFENVAERKDGLKKKKSLTWHPISG